MAAISVGVVNGTACIDLDYIEDSGAEVDCNVVMAGDGQFIEFQSTGEEATFSNEQLIQMLSLSEKGINELITAQKALLS